MHSQYKKYLLLDHGSVEVDGIYGTDEDIIRRATAAFGNHSTALEKRQFIRILLEHQHSPPFEFPQITLRIIAPLFIKMQWDTHKTGVRLSYKETINIITTDLLSSHYQNQTDEHYLTYKPIFYLPPSEKLASKAKKNHEVIARMLQEHLTAGDNYQFYLHHQKLDEEIARINLPLSVYVAWYWQQSLWNTLHWLKLRRDEAAQWEIRVYADTIEDIIKNTFPLTYDGYLQVVEGTNLLKEDVEELLPLLEGKAISNKLAGKLGVKSD